MKRKNLKMLDVFAGIGGFHLGIKEACEMLGIKMSCVGAIECDSKARDTYCANFPDVPMLGQAVGGDITKIDIDTLPNHDLLCGGFPCQPFSRNNMSRLKNNAKHKKQRSAQLHIDESDERGQLFYQLVEILRIKQPKYFIFENVKQLLTMKDGQTRVLDTIVEECTNVGYQVLSPTILDAKHFDTPQQRERVFIVGIRNDVKHKFEFPTPSMNKPCSVKDILEKKVDKKYLLSHAWLNRRTQMKSSGKYPHQKGELRLDVLKRNYHANKPQDNVGVGKIVTTATINGDTPSGVSRQHDRLYSIHGISRTIATFAHPGFDMGTSDKLKWRLLTPREHARLQGFPDSFCLPDSDNTSLKQLGNAVCVNVVVAIGLNLLA